jgi:hypothetical protein
LREYILIDFENVQPTTVGGLEPGTCGILLFLGEKQAKVSVELMQALQRFGEAVEVVRIAGSGPNAVDFHIAYTIGRLSQAHPGSSFTIVSRDTGFDPLVRYVTNSGIACRRVPSMGGAGPAKAKVAPAKKVPGPAKSGTKPAPKPAASKPRLNGRAPEVIARLKGLKAARPRKLKTLQSSIASWFKPALAEAEVAALVQQLASAGHLTVSDGKVTYALN